MKALTLTQPWASLVALGEKRIETRSWSTNYRGELAIHAAASIPPAWSAEGVGWVPALERRSRSRRYLWLNRSPDGGTCLACGPPESDNRTHAPLDHTYTLPRGVVVATCRLVDCLPMVAWAPVSMRLGETRPVWAARLLTGDTPEILVRDHLDVPRVPTGDPYAEDLTDQIPFGDFTPGRFGWILEDITPLPEPIPAKGFQRLWEWSPTVAAS